MEKMLQQYNTMLRVLDKHMDIMDMSVVAIMFDIDRPKQTIEAHAGHLMQNKVNIVALWGIVNNIQNQLQISSPPIQPASSTGSFPPVLAPTLAEAEELNNNEAAHSKDDESKMDYTTVASAVDQSTIADDSTLISNPMATVANSGILSGSTTNSVTPTRPTASVTNSAIATRWAASNESTVPTTCKVFYLEFYK
ncbi:hypothetical protein C0989_001676 [Termitomyces sp. Mn162]|nr:hypothetical protein C0989_001676 [Termitomyces sp. Mn162]